MIEQEQEPKTRKEQEQVEGVNYGETDTVELVNWEEIFRNIKKRQEELTKKEQKR